MYTHAPGNSARKLYEFPAQKQPNVFGHARDDSIFYDFLKNLDFPSHIPPPGQR